MGAKFINLVPEEEIKKNEIKYKVEKDLIDNDSFNLLNEEEKNNVKKVLFEMYSKPVDPSQALTAIEFMIFGLSKMMFKIFGENPQNLNEEEKSFYNAFKMMVNNHEIDLNKKEEYIPYIESKMEKTLENRKLYKEKKSKITGRI